jgi:hypothetical protein
VVLDSSRVGSADPTRLRSQAAQCLRVAGTRTGDAPVGTGNQRPGSTWLRSAPRQGCRPQWSVGGQDLSSPQVRPVIGPTGGQFEWDTGSSVADRNATAKGSAAWFGVRARLPASSCSLTLRQARGIGVDELVSKQMCAPMGRWGTQGGADGDRPPSRWRPPLPDACERRAHLRHAIAHRCRALGLQAVRPFGTELPRSSTSLRWPTSVGRAARTSGRPGPPASTPPGPSRASPHPRPSARSEYAGSQDAPGRDHAVALTAA